MIFFVKKRGKYICTLKYNKSSSIKSLEVAKNIDNKLNSIEGPLAPYDSVSYTTPTLLPC